MNQEAGGRRADGQASVSETQLSLWRHQQSSAVQLWAGPLSPRPSLTCCWPAQLDASLLSTFDFLICTVVKLELPCFSLTCSSLSLENGVILVVKACRSKGETLSHLGVLVTTGCRCPFSARRKPGPFMC